MGIFGTLPAAVWLTTIHCQWLTVRKEPGKLSIMPAMSKNLLRHLAITG